MSDNQVCTACRRIGDGTAHTDGSGFPCNGPYRTGGKPMRNPVKHAFLKGQCIFCYRERGTEQACIGTFGPSGRISAWKHAIEAKKASRWRR